MADIRIKDLTTLESASLTGDVFVIDGTTGTRKLSAFSPSFGGNATVTGTLTAGGGILSAGVSGSVTVNSTGTGALKIDNPTNPNLYFYSNGSLKTQINYVASSSSFVVDHADQSEIKLNVFGGGTTTVGGRLLVSSTTASTSTSSGALVVSGGVGVAGAVNVGGTLTVNGAGPHAFAGAITINPSSGDIQQNFQRSGTGKGILAVPGTAGNIVADSAVDDFVVRTTSGKAFRVTTDGGSTSSLSVTSANATFGGNITTAAPAGGTAAAWKLGTVATVSPTSPNRTIEVDIGGTIYYIHAKTTNN